MYYWYFAIKRGVKLNPSIAHKLKHKLRWGPKRINSYSILMLRMCAAKFQNDNFFTICFFLKNSIFP